jgi:hypothetical protein
MYIWTSPNGKAYKQIDHIFMDTKWQSSVLESDQSKQQIMILTTICWWQNREKLTVSKNNAEISYGNVPSQEIKQGRG